MLSATRIARASMLRKAIFDCHNEAVEPLGRWYSQLRERLLLCHKISDFAKVAPSSSPSFLQRRAVVQMLRDLSMEPLHNVVACHTDAPLTWLRFFVGTLRLWTCSRCPSLTMFEQGHSPSHSHGRRLRRRHRVWPPGGGRMVVAWLGEPVFDGAGVLLQ